MARRPSYGFNANGQRVFANGQVPLIGQQQQSTRLVRPNFIPGHNAEPFAMNVPGVIDTPQGKQQVVQPTIIGGWSKLEEASLRLLASFGAPLLEQDVTQVIAKAEELLNAVADREHQMAEEAHQEMLKAQEDAKNKQDGDDKPKIIVEE